MTRNQFIHRAKITIMLLSLVDTAREQGESDMGEYSLPLALLAMIEDLDFDWYLFLKTGITVPDVQHEQEEE
jgi:hypothetical protein